MAQVAILLTSTGDPRVNEISRALGILLGCPVLTPGPVADALTKQTGPIVPSADLRRLALDTVWRTAGLVEAGVIVEAHLTADDAESVRAGIANAGAPRTVEVWCGPEGGQLGVTPVMHVADPGAVDMDALVQEISARFV